MSHVSNFSECFQIPADTQGVELNIFRKCPDRNLSYGPEKTVLMVHGATYSSGSLYDTPVEGASFMDHLAAAGFDVYAVDIRGYGRSTRPVEFQQPASSNAPLGRTDQALRDFTSAANFVLRMRDIEQLNVFGMSWGGTVAAAYSVKNGAKVRRLGLLAPQWLSDKRIPIDAGGELGAWRVVNMDAAKQHWLSGAPVAKREGLIPCGAFETWAANSIRYESDDGLRSQNSFKAGNGPIQDIREYWTAGKSYYNPADIKVPLILIHGEWDIDVTIDLAKDWFLQASAAPDKRWLEVGEATHMLLLEKNRMLAINGLISFWK